MWVSRVKVVGRRCCLFLGMLIAVPAGADDLPLTFAQALQRLLDTHPRLEIAGLQAERAKLGKQQVESQLGWTLDGQLGVARDLTFALVPSDRIDVTSNLERQLASGSSIGLGAGYSHEESEFALFPGYPNPADTTNLDLYYRRPFSRGSGNPQYRQGLVKAEAEAVIAEAAQQATRDQLASQLIEIFFAAALTYAQVENTEKSIANARRLKSYIRGNVKLGISEKKDALRVEAQLQAQVAEHRRLLELWAQQRTSMNRLMSRLWSAEFRPVITDNVDEELGDVLMVYKQVEKYSPALQTSHARLRLAEAALAQARDQRKDKLDLVFSVGGHNISGDTSGVGDSGDSNVTGGVRLEYHRSLDRRGPDAIVNQAQLDRSIFIREIKVIEKDLRYNAASLLAEIRAGQLALAGYQKSLTSERAKYQEALQRYRTGRTDADRLIQFENEMFAAELAVARQNIELARKRVSLELLRGSLWKTVESNAVIETRP